MSELATIANLPVFWVVDIQEAKPFVALQLPGQCYTGPEV